MKTTKPQKVKPRIPSTILLQRYRSDLARRVREMHALAADMCGAHESCKEMRAELRETKKLLMQLIFLAK